MGLAMPSTLTWLDHDGAARERSLRILALFREKESRDEIGIGAIRDAIADQLFPGTSTIQTRLRYMLLVPWIYQRLESKRVDASHFSDRARKDELALVRPLLDAREKGVYGSVAKSTLKRLPSSVYWAGLASWRIRRFQGSQQDYFASVDRLYANRSRSGPGQDDRRDAEDRHADSRSVSWHPKLPAAPEGFPEKVDLQVTAEESAFLVDCITRSAGDSLLGWLVLHGKQADVQEPWLHPQSAQFPPSIKDLLHHGRLFSDLVEGAARLYNLCLADHAQHLDVPHRGGVAEEHREALSAWRRSLDMGAMRGWSLDVFWEKTLDHGHAISVPTRRFVEAFLARVQATTGGIADDSSCRDLVRLREESLKGARSRFRNRGALAQWSGNAGTRRLNYRWPTVKAFLSDLAQAKGAK